MAGQNIQSQHDGNHSDVVIDPVEQPSEEWGWTGEFPRLSRGAGWGIVLAILVMLVGNHVSLTADIWLVCVAAVLVGVLIRDARRRRTSWRN